MSKYPQLTEMGVLHPEQIDRYSVNSIDYTDVLRIVYERPKGSILPQTRTYRFPRVQQEIDDPKEGEDYAVMVTHPSLRAAVDELKALLCTKERVKDVAAEILEEMSLLQEDVSARCECIKMLLTQIPTVEVKK